MKGVNLEGVMETLHNQPVFYPNLLSGSTLPPPLFPVLISILYTRIQCVREGVCGSGPQTDEHLPDRRLEGHQFTKLGIKYQHG
jgi:hypothetical protein